MTIPARSLPESVGHCTRRSPTSLSLSVHYALSLAAHGGGGGERRRRVGRFPARGQSRRGSLYVRQFRETILTPRVVHSITILLSARCRFKFSTHLYPHPRHRCDQGDSSASCRLAELLLLLPHLDSSFLSPRRDDSGGYQRYLSSRRCIRCGRARIFHAAYTNGALASKTRPKPKTDARVIRHATTKGGVRTGWDRKDWPNLCRDQPD